MTTEVQDRMYPAVQGPGPGGGSSLDGLLDWDSALFDELSNLVDIEDIDNVFENGKCNAYETNIDNLDFTVDLMSWNSYPWDVPNEQFTGDLKPEPLSPASSSCSVQSPLTADSPCSSSQYVPLFLLAYSGGILDLLDSKSGNQNNPWINDPPEVISYLGTWAEKWQMRFSTDKDYVHGHGKHLSPLHTKASFIHVFRRSLFRAGSILNHSLGDGPGTFAHKRLAPLQASDGTKCTSFFVEPVQWMADALGVLDGQLLCPKCNAKLGSYNWYGDRCSCGRWVTPAFQAHKNRVDEVKPLSIHGRWAESDRLTRI